jgi:hypothetical protein
MPTKRQQLRAAAAELIRDHLVPRLRAQRARERQLLDVLAAASSESPQPQQPSKTVPQNCFPQVSRSYSPPDAKM